MNQKDVLTLLSISNHIKKFWDYMVSIEENIFQEQNPILEPLFRKFMEKGYKINELCTSIKEHIDPSLEITKEFFDDILYIVLKVEFLIEKHIPYVSRNIIITFQEYKKNCEKMFYWTHESYIRLKFDIYSL